MLLSQLVRQTLRRLADDLQLTDYRVLPVCLVQKPLSTDRRISLDSFECLQDVSEIHIVAIHND